MLQREPLIAFAATTNPQRAASFYRDVLGLKQLADEPFALVFEAHGIMLRIQKVQSLASPPYTTLGWQVADIDGVVDGLKARGVVFERYPHFEQDERGIWKAPTGARVAWFKDPDGNLLSLTAFD